MGLSQLKEREERGRGLHRIEEEKDEGIQGEGGLQWEGDNPGGVLMCV